MSYFSTRTLSKQIQTTLTNQIQYGTTLISLIWIAGFTGNLYYPTSPELTRFTTQMSGAIYFVAGIWFVSWLIALFVGYQRAHLQINGLLDK